jgi:hypothetical protein
MGIAALPSEKRDGGRGSLRRRLRRMLETGELVGWCRIAQVDRSTPVLSNTRGAKGTRCLPRYGQKIGERLRARQKSNDGVQRRRGSDGACLSAEGLHSLVVSETYPMLIKASRIVIESEARIEFNGIGVPNVVTCQGLVW